MTGESHHILPVPSTFIIGADGTIHFQYTNTDYKVRLAPGVLIAAARSAAKGNGRAASGGKGAGEAVSAQHTIHFLVDPVELVTPRHPKHR